MIHRAITDGFLQLTLNNIKVITLPVMEPTGTKTAIIGLPAVSMIL
jgi:hypothetical protein